jgi:hypothetical protein
MIYYKKIKDEIILVGKIMEADHICSQRVIEETRMKINLVSGKCAMLIT